jgi:hypothetical protein
MAGHEDPLVRGVMEAFERSLDKGRLKAELQKHLPSSKPAPPPAAHARRGSETGGDAVAREVLEKFAMADVLDGTILEARPRDASFPLRVFFGELSGRAREETAFALGSGLNFYFRALMEEETKIRLGLEVSRLYYTFADEAGMERDVVRQLSPLLAKLLSTELDRVRLEAVDHIPVFDSDIHERSEGSNASSSSISGPRSFLVRVIGNDRVRFKASVRT